MKVKSRRHFRCPSCGALGGRVALWGMPSAEAAADDVFIAGCSLEVDPKTGFVFDRGCIECGHLWTGGKKNTRPR